MKTKYFLYNYSGSRGASLKWMREWGHQYKGYRTLPYAIKIASECGFDTLVEVIE